MYFKDYVKILKDLIKTLQKEKFESIQKYEDVKQELDDAKNDLRLLREQITRQRIGIQNEGLTTAIRLDTSKLNRQPSNSNSMSSSLSCYTLSSSATNPLKENLIKENELLREQRLSLENELKILQCRLDEIEIERDSFKAKYTNLNKLILEQTSTSSTLTDFSNNNDVNNNRLTPINVCVNVDELVAHNKSLKETNSELMKEVQLLKFSSNGNSGNQDKDNDENPNVNKSQIKSLAKKADSLLANYDQVLAAKSLSNQDGLLFIDVIRELKQTVEQMLDVLNDKTLANKHQKKVNKMLALRVQELESQVSSSLRDFIGQTSSPIVAGNVSEDANRSLIKFDDTFEKA